MQIKFLQRSYRIGFVIVFPLFSIISSEQGAFIDDHQILNLVSIARKCIGLEIFEKKAGYAW